MIAFDYAIVFVGGGAKYPIELGMADPIGLGVPIISECSNPVISHNIQPYRIWLFQHYPVIFL